MKFWLVLKGNILFIFRSSKTATDGVSAAGQVLSHVLMAIA